VGEFIRIGLVRFRRVPDGARIGCEDADVVRGMAAETSGNSGASDVGV
jgi:hypothetical protein